MSRIVEGALCCAMTLGCLARPQSRPRLGKLWEQRTFTVESGLRIQCVLEAFIDDASILLQVPRHLNCGQAAYRVKILPLTQTIDEFIQTQRCSYFMPLVVSGFHIIL